MTLDVGQTENGWYSFTDQHVDPFTEYEYAVRPFGYVNGALAYGTYGSLLKAATLSDQENLPQVALNKSDGQTLSVTATPATGNVGALVYQWQQYIPERGGWIDLLIPGASTDALTIPSGAGPDDYRCCVSQRVGNEIYTVYSNSSAGGKYVFVAGKSREYQKDGQTVVDYVLVNEDGTVEAVSSANTGYNTKYVYTRGYDENGDLLLELDGYTAQRRSVTEAESARAEVNGGSEWKSDSGHEFSIAGNSKVWNVEALVSYLAKRSYPFPLSIFSSPPPGRSRGSPRRRL